MLTSGAATELSELTSLLSHGTYISAASISLRIPIAPIGSTKVPVRTQSLVVLNVLNRKVHELENLRIHPINECS